MKPTTPLAYPSPLPPPPRGDAAELEIHKKYFQAGLFTSFVVSLLTAVLLVAFGMAALSLIAWAFLLVEVILFWLFLTRPQIFPVLLHVNVFICFLVPFVLQVLLGGFMSSGGIGLWAIVVPMSAIILRMPLSWFWYLSLAVLEVAAMGLEIHMGVSPPACPCPSPAGSWCSTFWGLRFTSSCASSMS